MRSVKRRAGCKSKLRKQRFKKALKRAFFVLHLGVTVSLLTFTVFEFRPNLLRYVNLGGIRYFAQKEQYLPDPVLVFTPRSSEELVVWDFRGDLYRADLGIETPVIP